MNHRTISFLILILLIAGGCRKEKDYILSYRLPGQKWGRFNKLQFELPVEPSSVPVDIYFFAHPTKRYEYDNLDFNMIMTTPSGEERIREFHFEVKRKDGGFTGECSGDSCSNSIPIQKELYLTKKGFIKIEIENLVPRMEVKELLCVGISMHRRN